MVFSNLTDSSVNNYGESNEQNYLQMYNSFYYMKLPNGSAEVNITLVYIDFFFKRENSRSRYHVFQMFSTFGRSFLTVAQLQKRPLFRLKELPPPPSSAGIEPAAFLAETH